MINVLTSFAEAPRPLLILQACYDLVPMVLFLIGCIILLRTLYHKMVKGCYCLLAAGSIMVFAAGFLKAMHKMVMGIFQVDYVILDHQFTSTESVGFALLFVALIGMFTAHNTDHIEPKKAEAEKTAKTNAVALPLILAGLFVFADETTEKTLPEFTSSLPFIVLMIIGAAGFLISLIVISAKMKVTPAIILFALAIVFMMGMGYLSTKHNFEGAWYAITCNVCYQTTFMIGCILLKKKGLETAELFKPKAKQN